MNIIQNGFRKENEPKPLDLGLYGVVLKELLSSTASGALEVVSKKLELAPLGNK
jgi:hypothetical protein